MGLFSFYDEYFEIYESNTFGPLLLEYKFSFKSEFYALFNESKNNFQYFLHDRTKVCIENMVKKSDLLLKKFVLSSDKHTQYSNCRALKKILKIEETIDRFKEDEEYKDIKTSINTLLNSIDAKGYLYYALANNLEGSSMESLPKEIVGHIFHYVDHDINF